MLSKIQIYKLINQAAVGRNKRIQISAYRRGIKIVKIYKTLNKKCNARLNSNHYFRIYSQDLSLLLILLHHVMI